ncbi:Uncharacterised protein [Janthinobacterium lividum]|uniref:hypothetical protein n=1 Tax=Janthinobacterium lividum TaxID=29581 RepID=UPI000E060761|nr:hypothetical protein [Janthinobacterium lividum]STR18221.1 Uncharacterised protein [Janthinobacterium lividum]
MCGRKTAAAIAGKAFQAVGGQAQQLPVGARDGGEQTDADGVEDKGAGDQDAQAGQHLDAQGGHGLAPQLLALVARQFRRAGHFFLRQLLCRHGADGGEAAGLIEAHVDDGVDGGRHVRAPVHGHVERMLNAGHADGTLSARLVGEDAAALAGGGEWLHEISLVTVMLYCMYPRITGAVQGNLKLF